MTSVTRKVKILDLNIGKYNTLKTMSEAVLRLRNDVWRVAGNLRNVGVSKFDFRKLMVARNHDNHSYGLPQRVWRQNVETGHREVQLWIESCKTNYKIKAKIFRHSNGDEALAKLLFTALMKGEWSATPWLRRHTKKMLQSVPRPSQRLRFSLDNGSFGTQRDEQGRVWIAIMGLTRGRIKLNLGKLPDEMIPTSEVQIFVNSCHDLQLSMTIDEAKVCKTEAPKDGRDLAKPRQRIAADAGRTEVFVDDEGTIYGTGFGKMCESYDAKKKTHDGQRNKIRAHAEKLQIRAETARNKGHRLAAVRLERKRQNVIDNNLGSQRRDAAHTKHRAKTRDLIFRAAHELASTAHEIVTEDLTATFKRSNFGRRQNRLNSGWMRSIFAEATASAARRRGSLAIQINPAYTSQQVNSCGHLGVRGGGFVYCNESFCSQFREKFDDDANAARNIYDRADDREITLKMTPKQVKSVIVSRYGQPQNGGALSHPGLSCVAA